MKDQPNIIYIVCHGLERMKAVTIMDFNPPIFLDLQARSQVQCRLLCFPRLLPITRLYLDESQYVCAYQGDT